jgi:hypothetical protein
MWAVKLIYGIRNDNPSTRSILVYGTSRLGRLPCEGTVCSRGDAATRLEMKFDMRRREPTMIREALLRDQRADARPRSRGQLPLEYDTGLGGARPMIIPGRKRVRSRTRLQPDQRK